MSVIIGRNTKSFFTSDTHFGHGNIIKYSKRPFLAQRDKDELDRIGGSWHRGTWKGKGSSNWRISKESIQIMDNYLIDQINKTVGKDDVLFHLGDFALPGNHYYYEICKEYFERINCQKIILIWGNHDKKTIGGLFEQTHDILNVNLEKFSENLVLCHYSMAIWDRSHRKAINLYGHSHAEAENWLETIMPGRRSMDVGVDNAARILGEYRPFSDEEIIRIMNAKNGYFFGGDITELSNTPSEEVIQELSN